MDRLRGLTVAFAVLVILALVGVLSLFSSTLQASGTTSGPVGTLMQVSGINFGSNETVSILFDNQQITTVGADSGGSFFTSVDVPALPAGIYRVRIGLIARTFTITSSFTVIPSSGLS